MSDLVVGVQRPIGLEHLGYGTFSVNLVKGLQAIGVNVREPVDIAHYKEPPESVKSVIWPSVPGHAPGKWKGQFAALFTMWEAELLPPPFTATFHNYDLIIAPSKYNVEQFSTVADNVVQVPLGYDSTVWQYIDRPRPSDEFYFLFSGAGAGLDSRKGTNLVIEGFQKAFPNWERMTPRPRLIIKCLVQSPQVGAYAIVEEGKRSLEELVGIYQRAHAMILPSHGEGWGYHPQQAMATGLPVILSDIPGHHDYNWMDGFLPLPVRHTKALPFLYGDSGNWWTCDVDDVAVAYREVYDNYDRWADAAKRGADQMRSLDHVNMAAGVVEAVGAENMVACDSPSQEWVKFTEMEYKIRVNKYIPEGDCNIGGTRYILSPGQDYWIPASHRQVLEEAKVLANVGEVIGRLPGVSN